MIETPSELFVIASSHPSQEQRRMAVEKLVASLDDPATVFESGQKIFLLARNSLLVPGIERATKAATDAFARIVEENAEHGRFSSLARIIRAPNIATDVVVSAIKLCPTAAEMALSRSDDVLLTEEFLRDMIEMQTSALVSEELKGKARKRLEMAAQRMRGIHIKEGDMLELTGPSPDVVDPFAETPRIPTAEAPTPNPAGTRFQSGMKLRDGKMIGMTRMVLGKAKR